MKDNKIRCDWAGNDPLYINYHDLEWGVPVHNDRKLYEMLILEGAQAGLSWITVLKKRKNYLKAFDNFDVSTISQFRSDKIISLLNDPGIIRNKLKINATIQNAKGFILIQNEFESFDKYIWAFVDNKPIKNSFEHFRDLPAKTQLAEHISRDLKKRGFNFVGPTIMYSFMQACGLVNDHLTKCFRYTEV